MTFSYTFNIPNGPDNPSNDQPDMQINTNSIGGILGVDHVSFNLPNGGFHTIIHQVPLISDPAPISGIGQLYSKFVTINAITDTQLFYITGLGGISELTGSNATNTGFVWAGGILFQWGQVTGTNSSFTTQNFNIPFPTECFNVTTQIYGTGTVAGGAGTIDIRKSTVGANSFQWAMVTNSSQYTGFYWFAIGA